jgi:putative Mg2+ transporter-C (MgtC) family protein
MLGQEVLRIVVALIIGMVVGWERHQAGKQVGTRTMGLVCMGCSAATVLASTNFPLETARVFAGLLTGIGFLGAGAIMSEGRYVKGLTTAATIWTMAIIGVTVGLGQIWLGLITAGLMLFLLRIYGLLNLFRHR